MGRLAAEGHLFFFGVSFLVYRLEWVKAGLCVYHSNIDCLWDALLLVCLPWCFRVKPTDTKLAVGMSDNGFVVAAPMSRLRLTTLRSRGILRDED